MRVRTAALPVMLASLTVTTPPTFAGSSNHSLSTLFEATGNYQNPGARSLGLGGAFIALADDASAAELNPAGLTQLTKPEAGAEFRRLDTVTESKYAGAFRSGRYGCFTADLSQGPCDATFSDRKNFLSYVSLVTPVGTGSTLAIYRHVLDRQHLFAILPVLDFEGGGEATGAIADLDRHIVRTGISFARKIVEPLSFGLSLHVDSVSQVFRLTTYSTDYQDGGPLGGDPTVLDQIEDSSISQEKLGATAGVYWRPSEAFSAGASYSSSVRFNEKRTIRYCPLDSSGLAHCDFSNPFGQLLYSYDDRGSFTFPYRLGISAAYRPTSWLVVAAEGDRVGYSATSTSFAQCAVDDNGQCLYDSEGNGVIDGFDQLAPKNVWELHAGAEAVVPFAGSGLIGIRAGYWHDPDHSFQYRGCTTIPNSAGQSCRNEAIFNQFFPPLGSRDHFAGGIGVAWDWGQLDVGYDWVRQTHASTLAASVVIRMK